MSESNDNNGLPWWLSPILLFAGGFLKGLWDYLKYKIRMHTRSEIIESRTGLELKRIDQEQLQMLFTETRSLIDSLKLHAKEAEEERKKALNRIDALEERSKERIEKIESLEKENKECKDHYDKIKEEMGELKDHNVKCDEKTKQLTARVSELERKL